MPGAKARLVNGLAAGLIRAQALGKPGPPKLDHRHTNAGHAYAVIAGLRWDTSGNHPGISGPRWHKNLRTAMAGGYLVRHPGGY